jgi:hypothetical protein
MFKRKNMDIALILLAFVLLVSSSSQAAVAAPTEGANKSRTQATVIKYKTLTAAAFGFSDTSVNATNNGFYFYSGGGTVIFHSGFNLPHNKIIKSITLYAIDQNATKNACARIYLVSPAIEDEVNLVAACTKGSSLDMKIKKETLSHKVPQNKGTYIYAWVEDSGIEVYAVKIGYK